MMKGQNKLKELHKFVEWGNTNYVHVPSELNKED